MTNQTDTRPPVAPKAGHYATHRNGEITRWEDFVEEHTEDGVYYCIKGYDGHYWDEDGECFAYANFDIIPDLDIIATISPAMMAAIIDDRVPELVRAANALLDKIDAYHSEELVLMPHHHCVRAVSEALAAFGDLS